MSKGRGYEDKVRKDEGGGEIRWGLVGHCEEFGFLLG